MDIRDFLEKHDAYKDIREWAAGKSLYEIWHTCERGDYLAWLCEKAGCNKRTLVTIGMKCVMEVPILMSEPSCILFVESCRLYLSGEISHSDLCAVTEVETNCAAYSAAHGDAFDALDNAACCYDFDDDNRIIARLNMANIVRSIVPFKTIAALIGSQ